MSLSPSEGSSSLSLKISQIGGSSASKSNVEEVRESVSPDVYAVFQNCLKSILDIGVARSGVLIVVDEFDRVKDKLGLASLMKSLNSQVKFALVGVSTNVTDLIGDHESVARQLTGGCVRVEPMTSDEIYDLFNRAEASLQGEVKFPDETRDYIASLAKGHPFLVQMLGLNSTIAALRSGSSEVSRVDAEDALNEIAVKGTAPIQESMYKAAVAHSYTREVVLKEFACMDDEEIRTTPVYARISEKLGLADQNAISVYMGHLTSEKHGTVLEKTRERYYRFRDSLFKAYAASRPFLLQPNQAENEGD